MRLDHRRGDERLHRIGQRARRIGAPELGGADREPDQLLRLIERAAQASGPKKVMALMHERLRDFNEITEGDLARGKLAA